MFTAMVIALLVVGVAATSIGVAIVLDKVRGSAAETKGSTTKAGGLVNSLEKRADELSDCPPGIL